MEAGGVGWVLSAALPLLRRGLPETLAWSTAAAALLLRAPFFFSFLPAGSPSWAHLALVGLRDWLPIGQLAWQVGLRGGVLWQLAPLLPVVLGPPLFTHLLPNFASSSRWASMGLWGLGWVLALVSLGAMLAFPPVPFPQLDSLAHRGIYRYDVGLRHGEEEDSKDPSKKRIFHVWYPSSPSSSTRSTSSSTSSKSGATRKMNISSSSSSSGDHVRGHYFPSYKSQMELMFESMAYRLPSRLVFSHLQYVRPDAAPDGPLLLPTEASGGGWPVIVFSHGLYGFPSLYSHLCSSLASLGYVVLAIGHTDGSGYIVSPTSGEVITAFEPLPTSPSGQEVTGPELWKFRNQQLEVRIDDIEACLDILQRWNSDAESPFYEVLDLERIAVAGHSFGGGTSLGLALRQAKRRAESGTSNDLPQVKAAILFDGWMYPLRGSEGPAFDKTIAASTFESSVPTLFINAEMWKGSENYFRLNVERIKQLCNLSQGRWHSFTLKGSGHHNWNDFPFYTPIVSRAIGLVRELDVPTGHELTIALVDAFLSESVKGRTDMDRIVSTLGDNLREDKVQ